MRGRPRVSHVTPEMQDFLLFGSKTCIDCGAELPACGDFFNRDEQRADGLKGVCRGCNAGRERARYAARTAAAS